MSLRFDLLVSAAVIGSAACAAGGGGTGAAPAGPARPAPAQAAPPQQGAELPAWVDTLPEGVEPRDNRFTGLAAITISRAYQAEAQGDSAGAAELWSEAYEQAVQGLAADQGNPLSYLQAGQTQANLGNLEAADSLLARAQELYPRYVIEIERIRENAWIDTYNLALSYMNEGNVDRAIAEFERAEAIYGKRPEGRLNLASIYVERGEYSEAIEAYQGALEVIRTPEYRQFQDSTTLSLWDENVPAAQSNLGSLYIQLDRYQDAADLYNQLLQEDPGNVQYLANLSVALVEMGMTDSASVVQGKLLDQPGLDSQSYFQIGVSLYNAERYEMAADAFSRASNGIAAHRDALFNQAQSLFFANDFEGLLPVVQRLKEVDPYGLGVYRLEIQALNSLGRQEQLQVAVVEFEALPFYIDRVGFQGVEEGATIAGEFTNAQLEPGSRVVLRFSYANEEGEIAATSEVEIVAPAREQAVQFTTQVESDDPLIGWRYEVVSM